MAWLSGYTTRKKLTIDNTKIDAGLSDFPVLVKLVTGNFDFANANSDGFDIRFTASNGTTLLKYERVRHDSGGEKAEYWVKVPTVSNSADTDFYIYYTTVDTADGADPTNVWDANYKAVYHLNAQYDGTASEVKDSTSNVEHGVANIAPTLVEGKISKCQDCDGANDYMTLPNLGVMNEEADWSWEGWLTTDGLGAKSYRNLWHLNGGREFRHDTDISLREYQQGGGPLIIAAGDVSTGTWYYIAFTWDWLGANGDGRLYQNDVERDNQLATTMSAGFNNVMILGRGGGAGREWDGKIEELRLSNIARSAAWLKASYNTGNDSLLTYAAEEEVPVNAIFFGCNF